MYENIKAEMAKRNINYMQFARIIEIKPNTLATRFAGMSEFKLPELEKMADYFNCSIDYLAGREVFKNATNN